ARRPARRAAGEHAGQRRPQQECGGARLMRRGSYAAGARASTGAGTIAGCRWACSTGSRDTRKRNTSTDTAMAAPVNTSEATVLASTYVPTDWVISSQNVSAALVKYTIAHSTD